MNGSESLKSSFEKAIVEAIDLSEVFHIDNQPILNGVFAVEKSGEPAPGECRVTRLNLVPTSALQRLAYARRPPHIIWVQQLEFNRATTGASATMERRRSKRSVLRVA